MGDSRVWFIIGALTGFGRLLTEYLLKQGDRVVVTTLRKPEALSDLVNQYPPTRLLVVKLDGTHHAEIPAAFVKAQEAFGRIDVVFINAGEMINGELDPISDVHTRGVFEMNFRNAAQVSREAVRFFRDVNQPRGGRLLHVSSGLDIVSHALSGHYRASRFALEALMETLANGLDPSWNIKITILDPGPFLTDVSTTNNVLGPHRATVGPELAGQKWRVIFQSGVLVDGDPKKACMACEKASRLEDPPIRLPLHKLVPRVANENRESV